MPGPYKNQSNHLGSEDEHPFLTPKGYRLMNDRKRVADSVPVEFPKFQVPQPTDANGEIIYSDVPVGTPIVNGQPVFPSSNAEPFSW